MDLSTLKPAPGSRHRRKIVGRGVGSGHGRHATRGMKGQRSRRGDSKMIGFEGGQMPLYRRLPKRGFNNVNRIEYAVINLRDLEDLKGAAIGLAELRAAGVLRANAPLLKVLGTGEITRAVTVSAHRFSDAAKAKIEKAGGKAILLKAATAAE